MAFKLADDLRALYSSNQIPGDLQEYLATQGVLTVKNLANHCDTKEAVVKTIIDPHGVHDKTNTVKINMKQCWREAEALTARGIKRTTEGVQETSIDEPLSVPVQEEIVATLSAKYCWDSPSHLRPNDQLLARIRREMERNNISFYPLHKVKSAQFSMRLPVEKRHKVGDSISIHIAGDEEAQDAPTSRLRSAFLQLEVLANGWGIAGCFIHSVDSAGPSSSTAKTASPKIVCSWQQAYNYFRTLRDRCELLVDTYQEQAVLGYFLQVEQAFRSHAV